MIPDEMKNQIRAREHVALVVEYAYLSRTEKQLLATIFELVVSPLRKVTEITTLESPSFDDVILAMEP
jgi:hypothetical protein